MRKEIIIITDTSRSAWIIMTFASSGQVTASFIYITQDDIWVGNIDFAGKRTEGPGQVIY